MSEHKNIFPIVMAILLSAIVVVIAVFLLVGKGNMDKETANATKEEAACLSDELLLGTYDVRFDYPDSVSRFVGIFEKDAAENYVLTILSDYAPRVVLLEMQTDGSLVNPDFGTGIVRYKEHLGKVTITFDKEDYRCTLVK